MFIFVKISKADNKELRGLKEDEYWIAFNRVLARHILQERNRHGGDFAVAWAFADTMVRRDAIRKIVGPELFFVVLTTVDQSILESRIEERERLYDLTKDLMKLSPNIEYLGKLYGSENEKQVPISSMAKIDDEHKVIELQITDEMKVENVANMIVEMVDLMIDGTDSARLSSKKEKESQCRFYVKKSK